MADAKTWAKRVAAWRASSLTAGEFATKVGVSPRTLRYWAWRVQREGKQEALVRVVRAEDAGAAPVRIAVSPEGADTTIEFISGESRVVVRMGRGREELAQILRELATALFEADRAGKTT
jgi:hypothetical protein